MGACSPPPSGNSSSATVLERASSPPRSPPWHGSQACRRSSPMLSLVATLAGILTGFGQHHHTFLTLRGETVTIQGGGLYGDESISMAAQAIGQDMVTLAVAIPLLVIATLLVRNGSVRGLVLRAGILLYFTYTYMLPGLRGRIQRSRSWSTSPSSLRACSPSSYRCSRSIRPASVRGSPDASAAAWSAGRWSGLPHFWR